MTGSGEYTYGSNAVLIATPAVGCEFVNWNDGVADNPRNITVIEDATYIATFAPVTELEYSSTIQYRIYGINKTIFVEPAVNYSIYSNTGQDVTALNGHLETGVYIKKNRQRQHESDAKIERDLCNSKSCRIFAPANRMVS